MQTLTAVSPDEAMLPLRERKKRKTRRLIINTAIELFTARGFDAVTLEDIAAVCEVSRGTVFNYFPYKELMVLEFMDVYMAEGLGTIRADLADGGDPAPLLWRALDVPKSAASQWPTFLCITAQELLHHEQTRADTAQRSLSFLPLVAEIPFERVRASNQQVKRAELDTAPIDALEDSCDCLGWQVVFENHSWELVLTDGTEKILINGRQLSLDRGRFGK